MKVAKLSNGNLIPCFNCRINNDVCIRNSMYWRGENLVKDAKLLANCRGILLHSASISLRPMLLRNVWSMVVPLSGK